MAVAAEDRDLTESVALLPRKEPEGDLPGYERPEEACLIRGRVQEPDEAHHGVQQARVQRAHLEGPHGGVLSRRGLAGLDHDRADEGGVEPEDDAKVRPLFGRFGDPSRGGKRGGGDEVVVGVVAVAIVAQKDLLGALRDHAKGGRGDAVVLRGGRGTAEQPEPPRRLDGPVLSDGPRDALGQLLAEGLRPAPLPF